MRLPSSDALARALVLSLTLVPSLTLVFVLGACERVSLTSPTPSSTPPSKDLALQGRDEPGAAASPPSSGDEFLSREHVYEGQGPIKVAPVEVVFEAQGLRLERQAWRLQELDGVAWRVRVARRDARLSVRAQPEVAPLEQLLPEPALPSAPMASSPWAAINGGFYEVDPKGGYRPMGVVVASGQAIHGYTHRGGSGLVVVEPDGRLDIIHRSAWATRSPPPAHALQSIDRLVDEGRSLVKLNDADRFAARSAVALSPDHVWFIVSAARASLTPMAQGRGYHLRKTSYLGMPLWAFARYIVEQTDAQQALNMDGAVSTHLIVQGAASEQRFEVRAERGTMSALALFLQKSAPP